MPNRSNANEQYTVRVVVAHNADATVVDYFAVDLQHVAVARKFIYYFTRKQLVKFSLNLKSKPVKHVLFLHKINSR